MLDLTLAVVSPHLDDAVLSLGAAIAARRVPVRVVTVLVAVPRYERARGGEQVAWWTA